MRTNQALEEILDQTIVALSDLNSGALHVLEWRIVALAESEGKSERDDVGIVLAKNRLLEIVLQNCEVNLGVLTRLHARNKRNQWAQ